VELRRSCALFWRVNRSSQGMTAWRLIVQLRSSTMHPDR
jgi:hypothetical protein